MRSALDEQARETADSFKIDRWKTDNNMLWCWTIV